MRKKKKKKGSRNWGLCPACKESNVLNRHHYLPQRFFGPNPFYIRICDTCHEEIEKLIPETRRLPACDYFEIAYCFIFKQTHIIRRG